MKKRYVILMLVCLSLAIVGCGKKESSDATIENVNEGIENVVEDDTEEITSSADETDNEINGEIDDEELESDLSTLGGVYMRADELIDVPIGLYSDGISKNLCNVSVPKNYYIYIQDTDDDGIKRDNFEIDGSKVAEAIENGLYDLKHPIEMCIRDRYIIMFMVTYVLIFFVEKNPKQLQLGFLQIRKIGRASCRERV